MLSIANVFKLEWLCYWPKRNKDINE